MDDDANASDGATLNGSLGSNKYAIVANLSQATWVGLYGGLPTGTLFVQLPNPWNVLNNGPGDTISLYNTVTSSSFFQLDYTSSTNGRSLGYTGTTVSGVSPYSALWVHTTTVGGGSSGDRHTAGSSNIQSAPEPASFALLGLAAFGLFTVVRRQRLAELAA